MPDRLPPLTALRAFEAAARHMSFAMAAAELNVTPAALSFQIKSLEEHFGAPLFIRRNRAVDLTEAGRALAPGTREAFQSLSLAWATARRQLDSKTLTVTAGPALTAKWLAPRLYDFARSHPDIELRFSASLRSVDLARDAVDVAIRFGTSVDDALYSLPTRREWATPAMTPEMAQQFPTPESLRDAMLIHDDSASFLSPPMDWAAWFRAVGVDYQPRGGTRFSNADHAVDAAIAGVGVVLARRPIIIKDVVEGRLVTPVQSCDRNQRTFPVLMPKRGRNPTADRRVSRLVCD